MKSKLIAACALLAIGPLTATAQDPGHCTYIQQNMFAGPFKVCDAPVSAAKCAELGTTDDNKDAVHAAGACPTDAKVGICDMGDAGTRVYYEGDAGGLEIGCGFQGGEWTAG